MVAAGDHPLEQIKMEIIHLPPLTQMEQLHQKEAEMVEMVEQVQVVMETLLRKLAVEVVVQEEITMGAHLLGAEEQMAK